MRIQAITISSRRPDPIKEPYYHLEAFEEACRRQNIVPHFLNEGPYCGLMSKPKHLLKYLFREGAYFDLVVVMDAWDLLPLTTLDEMAYNYKGFGVPIVFNAEMNCFPRSDLGDRFTAKCPSQPDGSFHPYRYLNSGFFIGETAAVITMLAEMRLDDIPNDWKKPDGTWENVNDQEFYSRHFLQDFSWPCSKLATLDYTGILCQTLHGSEPNEFAFIPDKRRIVSLLTKNQPCAVHGNGSGKEWLKRMIGWLGL